MPRFSVVIPYYNQPQYLRDCVDCLLRQTEGDWAATIVDDGSTGEAAAEADKQAERDPRVSVLRKPNGGLASARNAGLEGASGEFVMLLDSDDFLHPETFEQTGAALGQHDVGVIRFGCQEFDDSWSPVGRMRPSLEHRLGDRLTVQVLGEKPLRRAAFTNPTPVHAQLWRREALGDRRYDEALPSNEDWDFMIRYFGAGGRVVTEPTCFAFYRRHGASMNKNVTRMFETRVGVVEKNRSVFEADPVALGFLETGLHLAGEAMEAGGDERDAAVLEVMDKTDLTTPDGRYFMLYLGNALRGLGGDRLPRVRARARRLRLSTPRLAADIAIGGTERVFAKMKWRAMCRRRIAEGLGDASR